MKAQNNEDEEILAPLTYKKLLIELLLKQHYTTHQITEIIQAVREYYNRKEKYNLRSNEDE